MSRPCPPRERLHQWSRALPPGAWSWLKEEVDSKRAMRGGDSATWPPYVFLPMPEAGLLANRMRVAHGLVPIERGIELARPACEVACFCAWRMTQGIYRFDPTVYAALRETPITGDLPAELLIRLPEWCVYLETPDMLVPVSDGSDAAVEGVFAWLDHDKWPKNADVLTLGVAAEGLPLGIQHIPLIGTLEQAVRSIAEDWRQSRAIGAPPVPTGYEAMAVRWLRPVLSLLLYLCAANAEIGDGTRRPANPKPQRVKGTGWKRVFAAAQPTTWDVGSRMGAAIRRALAAETAPAAGGTHASPRAHIRRAHWHSYWIGARQDAAARKAVLRWLPPIAVNVDDVDMLPTTIRPVP